MIRGSIWSLVGCVWLGWSALAWWRTGVDPQATIAAVKTGNDDGLLYPEYVTCAMVWFADHHFDVTNNSYSVDPWLYWVPSDPTQTAGYEIIRRAVAYATSQGVVTVVAAGNANSDLDNRAEREGCNISRVSAAVGGVGIRAGTVRRNRLRRVRSRE